MSKVADNLVNSELGRTSATEEKTAVSFDADRWERMEKILADVDADDWTDGEGELIPELSPFVQLKTGRIEDLTDEDLDEFDFDTDDKITLTAHDLMKRKAFAEEIMALEAKYDLYLADGAANALSFVFRENVPDNEKNWEVSDDGYYVYVSREHVDD